MLSICFTLHPIHHVNSTSLQSTCSQICTTSKLSRPVLVFVTPDHFTQHTNKSIQLSQTLIQAGVSLIQLRDRTASKNNLKHFTKSLLNAGIPPQKLVLNGLQPSDIIQLSENLGIHIKEKDIPHLLPKAKMDMSKNSIIGCAVHSSQIAKQAMQIHSPDYFQIGTMFPTQSHPGKIPEGPQLITSVRSAVGPSPFFIAIGGINENNISQIMKSGGDGVAVISTLATAIDPATKAKQLLSACQVSSGDVVS